MCRRCGGAAAGIPPRGHLAAGAILFAGGDGVVGGPPVPRDGNFLGPTCMHACGAKVAHGFAGIDAAVVRPTADRVKVTPAL